jgi:hypothetical protein
LILVVAFERNINEDVVSLHDNLRFKLDSLCVGPTEWNSNLLLNLGVLDLNFRFFTNLRDQRFTLRLLPGLQFKARFKIPLLKFNTISANIVYWLIC